MSISRQEKIEALVTWHATPPELRSAPTLHQLALQIGAPPDGTFYALARSPEVRLKALTIISTSAVIAAPAILNMLFQSAEKGNVKAAEIYLNFVYKVIVDMPDPPKKRPGATRQDIEAIQAMARLGHVLASLGNDPVEAQRRVDAGEIPQNKLKDREEEEGQDKKAAQP